MKRRILLIITILLIVSIVIIGTIYLISYRNKSIATSDNEKNINLILEDNINMITDKEGQTDEFENTNDNVIIGATEKIDEVNTEIAEIQNNTKSEKSNNNVTNVKKQEINQEKKQTSTSVTPTPIVTPQNIPASTETKNEEPKVDRCTNIHNHFLDVGNSGKWFNSKNDAIAYYNQQTKYWSDYLDNCGEENEDAAWEEYKKKCPSGYEVYSCLYCNRWTINFYYR